MFIYRIVSLLSRTFLPPNFKVCPSVLIAPMLKPEAAAQTGRKWWNPLEVRIDISIREGSGYWLDLDTEGRGFLLLHELGHVFHRLFDGSELKDNDTGDSDEAKKNREINNKLLSDNCIRRQL